MLASGNRLVRRPPDPFTDLAIRAAIRRSPFRDDQKPDKSFFLPSPIIRRLTSGHLVSCALSPLPNPIDSDPCGSQPFGQFSSTALTAGPVPTFPFDAYSRHQTFLPGAPLASAALPCPFPRVLSDRRSLRTTELTECSFRTLRRLRPPGHILMRPLVLSASPP